MLSSNTYGRKPRSHGVKVSSVVQARSCEWFPTRSYIPVTHQKTWPFGCESSFFPLLGGLPMLWRLQVQKQRDVEIQVFLKVRYYYTSQAQPKSTGGKKCARGPCQVTRLATLTLSLSCQSPLFCELSQWLSSRVHFPQFLECQPTQQGRPQWQIIPLGRLWRLYFSSGSWMKALASRPHCLCGD